MLCPACGEELTEVKVDDTTADVCDAGCGGIWFDRYELQRVDEPVEDPGVLLSIEPKAAIDDRGGRHCPKCPDVVMSRHFWSVKRQVEVDECPQCGGFWLDAGELEAIRGLFDTEQDRRNAGIEEFRAKFGDQIAEMDARNQARLAAVLEVTRKYRYICPSYFVRNSSEWGVF